MAQNTMSQLAHFGQSLWLDYISRSLLCSGKLQDMIAQGLRGMTSNPSIFNEAIGQSHDYDESIAALKESGKSPFEIYDALTIADIQKAADAFKDVYDQTKCLDGYVSLEINPKLASSTQESVDEGIRLYNTVNRPNVMIKVPATTAGYKITEELLALGINVNVTLIFSLEQYCKTAAAFIRGMDRLAKHRDDLHRVHSVASVFVSRIDSAIDAMIDNKLAAENEGAVKNKMLSMKGRAAVANCHLVIDEFKKIFSSDHFRSLAQKNCPVQRVLWASTGTKNPHYSDIKYVTELIAQSTVNTLPEKTILAFLDHGQVQEGFLFPVSDSRKVLSDLKVFEIDIDQVCRKLLADGLAAFEKSFEILLNSIEEKSSSFV